jgi:hypothetical protein
MEAEANRAASEKQNSAMMEGLASHTRRRWETMRDHYRRWIDLSRKTGG